MKHVLLVAAIIGIAFCAYSNSFDAGFLLDNEEIILKDGRVHTVTSDHIQRILTGQYWPLGGSSLYRPLTTLSYLFNYAVLGDGTNPSGYHWINFILHAINIALVYALGLALLEQIPAAFFLTAIWALHPLLTESVTNIVGRADLLAALGVLAALLLHRKAMRAAGVRRAGWLLAISLAVTAGMFSKESAIVVLAVIALYDLTFGQENSWRSRIPSYAAAVVPCLAFLYFRTHVLANAAVATSFPFTDNPLAGADFWTARVTAIKIIGKYLYLLVWPANLSYDYSYNEIPLFGWSLTHWEDWKAILSLIACAGAAVVAIRSWRRHKPVFFFIAFFFATLSPTSNLVIMIGSIMAERFLYLPSIGFAGCVVYTCRALSQRRPAWGPEYRYAAAAAAGVILLALSFRTYDRNVDWVDQGRFWQSGFEVAPGSFKTNLAVATDLPLLTQKDWARSISGANRTLTILDPLPDLKNTGLAYRRAGAIYRNFGEKLASENGDGSVATEPIAERWYRKSLNALLRSEKIELAQDEWNRQENARRGKPGLTFLPSGLYLQLGRTYMRLSDPEHARSAFERGRMLESDPAILEELAEAYRATGELHKAALALVEAVAVDPSKRQLFSKMLGLYAELDPSGCAVSRNGGTLTLNTNCPLVHKDICTASRNVASNFTRRWQHFEAASIRRTAVEELGCTPESLN